MTNIDPATPRRLLISAFGIHMGGGLVLLRALLGTLQQHDAIVLLDERLRGKASITFESGRVEVRYVARSMVARWRSLQRLAAEARDTDVLLCFNSLPPAIRSRARVVTFVQAPHFVGGLEGMRYAWLTRIRLALEAKWLRHGARHSDEIWAQTPTMFELVQTNFPASTARMAPLIDPALHDLLTDPARGEVSSAPSAPRFDAASFFYPADLLGHKNHPLLVAAWRMLASEDLHPRLALTLRDGEWAELQASAGRALPPNIVNLGRMPREQVLAELARSSALLFPSYAETFGLPMVEATALGVPIVASERGFVRDVCVPVQTFDPESPRSIADAVRRFMNLPRAGLTAATFWSATTFVEQLLS